MAAALQVLLLLLALAPSPAAVAAEAAAGGLPPVELFYRHPDVDEARLSPSGTRLAVTVNQGQRVALAVFDLGGGAPRIVAHYADADVRSFAWVNDERLVFSIVELSAGGGDQRWGPGLLSVGLDGVRPRLLVRTGWDFVANTAATLREPLEQNHALLAVPSGGGDEVVVGQYQFDAVGELKAVAPLRLNVLTGRTRSMAMGMPEGVTRWWLDPQGEPRVGESQRQGQVVVWWRAPGTETWKELARFAALARPFIPFSVDGAGQLYVTQPDAVPAGTTVLKRFDFATGKPEPEALVRTPGFDFRGRLVHDEGLAAARSAQALGVQVQTDAETAVWFDPRLARLQQLADQKLPGRVNRLSCRACLGDDAVVLVRSWSDQDPGQFWLYRAAAASWQRVGAVRKDVDPRQMATLDFHRVTTRDGLEIPVWVTLPPAPRAGAAAPPASAAAPAAPAAPLRRPAVLLVHGGPWVRGGAWRWDADAQFLASRGYVVIEPEFRGSTGYGARLHRAGFRQWGQAMQDDLADALQWAVGQGWVDPGRVCIAGASYGGYAALMGLVRHPALYRCGVAWVAVSDPRLLFEWSWNSDMDDEGRLYSLPQMIGDPVADAAMLAANAPLAQAARIQAPVLLAYGQQDRRVPIIHGDKLRQALRAAGHDPDWVVYPDEGHGWLRPDNRFDFARRMERFLAKHLQPAP
jgi:dipeptidyl aminopeptidase/acylaminoacyl peptidase